LGVELLDFFFMKEQPARPDGIDVVTVAEFVGLDVGVVKPALAAFDTGEGLVDGGAGGAEAHFGRKR